MLKLALAGVLGGALCGCSLMVEFKAQCKTSEDCDDGQLCRDETCVGSPAVDGAQADMSMADGAVADGAVADAAVVIDGALADMAVADMAVADMAVADMAVADMAVADGTAPDAAPPSTTLELEGTCHAIHGVDAEDALAENTILFGLLVPSTGELGGVGPQMGQAAVLALDEINQTGGVLGRRFGLVQCDTGTEPEQAAEAARWLVEVAKVPAIIGPSASASTIRVFNEVAFPSRTLVISPSSTSPVITDILDENLLWRTAPSDAIQGSAIAAHLLDRGYTKIAVINRDDTYGNGLQSAIRGPLCAVNRCGEADYFSRSYALDNPDAQLAVLPDLRAFGPDVVVLASFVDDGIRFINLAADGAGFENFVLSDGPKDVALLEGVNSETVLRSIIGTAPASPAGQTFQDFSNRFRNKWGAEPGVFNGQAYDAMYLLGFAAAAIVDEQPLTGPNLAAALGRLSEGPELLVGTPDWNRGVAILRGEGGTFNFAGASGPLDFGPKGEAPADIEGWYFDVDNQRIRTLGVMYTAEGEYRDVRPMDPVP